MRKVLVVLVLMAVALTGCAQKKPSVANKKNRRHLIEGTVFLKQGEVKKAAESFALSIKIDPNDFEGYFMLGEMFLRLKQYSHAASVMGAAVRQFPDSGLAHYLLATSLEGMGQLVPAIVAARQSAELFNAKGDQEGMQRAIVLLGALISAAKEQDEVREEAVNEKTGEALPVVAADSGAEVPEAAE